MEKFQFKKIFKDTNFRISSISFDMASICISHQSKSASNQKNKEGGKINIKNTCEKLAKSEIVVP